MEKSPIITMFLVIDGQQFCGIETMQCGSLEKKIRLSKKRLTYTRREYFITILVGKFLF